MQCYCAHKCKCVGKSSECAERDGRFGAQGMHDNCIPMHRSSSGSRERVKLHTVQPRLHPYATLRFLQLYSMNDPPWSDHGMNGSWQPPLCVSAAGTDAESAPHTTRQGIRRQKLGSEDLFWDACDVQLEINHLDVLWHTLAAATPSHGDGAGNI